MDAPNQFSIFPPGGLTPPKGLNSIMEGLVREILLKNPKNIYRFAYEYFERLIEIRKEASIEDEKEISDLIFIHQNSDEKIKKEKAIDDFDNSLKSDPVDNIVVEPFETQYKNNTSSTNADDTTDGSKAVTKCEIDMNETEKSNEQIINDIDEENDDKIIYDSMKPVENDISDDVVANEMLILRESEASNDDKNISKEDSKEDDNIDLINDPQIIENVEKKMKSEEINEDLSRSEDNNQNNENESVNLSISKSVEKNTAEENEPLMNNMNEETSTLNTDENIIENKEESGNSLDDKETINDSIQNVGALHESDGLKEKQLFEPRCETAEIPKQDEDALDSKFFLEKERSSSGSAEKKTSLSQSEVDHLSNDLTIESVENIETESNKSYSDRNNSDCISQAETLAADYEMNTRSNRNSREEFPENNSTSQRNSYENEPPADPIKLVIVSNNANEKDIFEKASVIIQKFFRGFLARVKVSEMIKNKKNKELNKKNSEIGKDKSKESPDPTHDIIHTTIEPHLYTVPEEKNGSYSTEEESSTFSSAATKIQAGVRGFLTRKSYQQNKTNNSSDTTAPSIGEDSKSLDETFDSGNSDDTVSKIIVATSSILIDQLEHFEKLENNKTLSTSTNLDSMETSRDGDDSRRRRLKREDAIQLHSPYSSGETSANKCSPGKNSEDEEPIGDLAQSIITEIISNSCTRVDQLNEENETQIENDGNAIGDESQSNEETRQPSKEITFDKPDTINVSEEKNLSIKDDIVDEPNLTNESEEKNDVDSTDIQNKEPSEDKKLSNDENVTDQMELGNETEEVKNTDPNTDQKESNKEEIQNNVTSIEIVEPKDNIHFNESFQSDDADVVTGTMKLSRPVSSIENEQKIDSNENTEENINDETNNNKAVNQTASNMEEQSNENEPKNELETVNSKNVTGDETKPEKEGVLAVADSELKTDDELKPVALQHSGEFHDVVLPTKIKRNSSIIKE